MVNSYAEYGLRNVVYAYAECGVRTRVHAGGPSVADGGVGIVVRQYMAHQGTEKEERLLLAPTHVEEELGHAVHALPWP